MWTCKNCETKNNDIDLYCACCGAKKINEHLSDKDDIKILKSGVWKTKQDQQAAERNYKAQNLYDSKQTNSLPEEYHVPAALDAQPVPQPVVRNFLHYLTMFFASALFIFTPSGFMLTAFLFFVPGMLLLAPVQSVFEKNGVELNPLQMFLLFYGLLVIIVSVVAITADRKEDALGKQFKARKDGLALSCSWPQDLVSAGERWALAVDGSWVASGASGSTVRIPFADNQTKKVTLAKYTCGKVEEGIPKEINNITWLSEIELKAQV